MIALIVVYHEAPFRVSGDSRSEALSMDDRLKRQTSTATPAEPGGLLGGLVVDDHGLIREALRGVLKEVKGDATVLEAAVAVRRCKSLRSIPG